MKDFFSRTFAWKVAISKCGLLTFIAMGNLLIASMQNWDAEYVSTLHWWNWLNLCISVLVAGANTIYTFLDKTYHTESEKIKQSIGDTQFLKKPTI